MPWRVRFNDLLGHTLRPTDSVDSLNAFVGPSHEKPAYCYHSGDSDVPPVISGELNANERNQASERNA